MKLGSKLLIRSTREPVEFRQAFKNGNVIVWSASLGTLRLHYTMLRRPCGRKGKPMRQVRNGWIPEAAR